MKVSIGNKEKNQFFQKYFCVILNVLDISIAFIDDLKRKYSPALFNLLTGRK
jgi:hypothetical protein